MDSPHFTTLIEILKEVLPSLRPGAILSWAKAVRQDRLTCRLDGQTGGHRQWQYLLWYLLTVCYTLFCYGFIITSSWVDMIILPMFSHCSDVIKAPWCLQSPTSPLFTQPFIQAHIKESIKAPRHWTFEGNSPVTGEFPAQMTSNAENASIWLRHHERC